MRCALAALVAAALTGCGYVGDPLPPALNIPQPVADLHVLQRGEKLLIDFTAPALTTELLGIKSFDSAELRVGGEIVSIPTPKPGEAAHVELPSREWADRDLTVQIVLAGPKGRKSAPSNTVAIHVATPLGAPVDVKAESHPDGVRVSWRSGEGQATQYRISREPPEIATVDRLEYIDKAVEMGKEYRYSVTAVANTNESLPSEEVSVTPRDTFPPAAPSNVNAIAGVNTVELAWDRNSEPDVKGYRVYRNGQILAEAVEAPSFSDKQVTSGQKYRYAVSAVDQTGNESGKSTEIEIAAP
jgi:fibronectin type 3 domain-containing protein